MSDTNDLHTKLQEWMGKEGYPTEFRVANSFRRQGFHVRQSYFVRHGTDDPPREIDVGASLTYDIGHNCLIRIYHTVECKWSRDKPWIVFTSSDTGMLPSACMCQTISSHLGESVLWLIAGDESLHNTTLFQEPSRSGFNGRQAFSSGKDHFYSSISSIVHKSVILAKEYDDSARRPGKLPRFGVIVFPLIVIDGMLYDAHYDATTNEVVLEQVDHIRCHWTGSASWPFHATVDVVSIGNLDDLLNKRTHEIDILVDKCKGAVSNIRRCIKSRDMKLLEISLGPRGVVGLPSLLAELAKKFGKY